MLSLVYTYKNIEDIENFFSLHNIQHYSKGLIQIFRAQEDDLYKEIYTHLNTYYKDINLIHVKECINELELQITLYDRRRGDSINKMQHSKREDDLLYKKIINLTTEGFWLLDDHLEIIDINSSLSTLLEYTKEDMIGKTPFEFIALQSQEKCFKIEEHLKEQTQRIFELSLRSKSGTILHFIANSTTIISKNSEIRTFSFLTDISKQKEIEEGLTNEIQVKIEENRDKDSIMYQQSRLASMGEMISHIAHQWRQPLNILALVMQDIYISSQLGTLDNEKVDKSYEKSNDVLQYMSQTIDDFRNFFNQSNEASLFNLNKTITSIQTLVGSTFEHRKIAFTTELNDSFTLNGSENELIQVIINLINNAQDAIENSKVKAGHVTLTVFQTDNTIVLQVKDNGGGVKESILPKIFDPYFTTKHKTQGTGLGLYMSRQIIQKSFDGTIVVINEEKGAAFSIEIPKA